MNKRESKKSSEVIQFECDIDTLSVYAMRYALGRRTYAPGDVCEVLIRNKHVLGKHTRELIVREVRLAIACGAAGDSCDVDHWRELENALVVLDDGTVDTWHIITAGKTPPWLQVGMIVKFDQDQDGPEYIVESTPSQENNYQAPAVLRTRDGLALEMDSIDAMVKTILASDFDLSVRHTGQWPQ